MEASSKAKVILVCFSQDSQWAGRLERHLVARALNAGADPLVLEVETWTDNRLLDIEAALRSFREDLQGAAAIMFLVSDELLASPFVRYQGFIDALIEAMKRTPALRVLCRPTKLPLDFLTGRTTPATTGDRSLAELATSNVDATLASIADVVISSIDPNRPNESAAAQRSNVGDAEEDAQPSTSATSTEQAQSKTQMASDRSSADVVPLTRLSEFKTSESIVFLMQRATEMASGVTPAIPVTTSFMFFACTESATTQPNWTAPFLREVILSRTTFYESTRDAYFQRKGSRGVRPRPRRPSGVPTMMTRYLFQALERARDIAVETIGNPEIHARHLIVALLQSDETKERSGALSRLSEMNVDPAALRESLFDWMRSQGDNDAAWEKLLLGSEPAVPRLSGFSTDGVGGEDLLGIEPEVRALASLIAARTVAPPLSIGLFGEWGSGKTFFMRELRTAIDGLSREARECDEMQRDIPFYKHIVQIEFNAWHYVEGNLWASLVEHILDNLYPNEDRTGTRSLQAKLIKKLADEKALALATSNAVDHAKDAATAAQNELTDAREKLDAKTKELAQLNADRVRRDFALTGAHQPVVDALDQLGLSKVGASAVELEGALREVHAVLSRGQRFLTPLVRAKDRKRRFVWLFLSLLGAPLMAIVVRLVMQGLGSTTSDIYAYATGAATLIASGVPWLKKQAEWMSARLDEAEKAQKKFDEEMAKESATHVQKVTEAEQKLRELTSALDAALQKHAEAKSREAAAAAELAAATTGRLLANFITDRASSSDYRKHLGVLAIIRDDFEKLSAFIEEVNWTLSPEDATEKPRTDGLTRFATLAQEEKDKDGRINRIVLYIDDLDRCPPNKVVEVLQAVHLLLAFPLFVVVVGVDARWITRSLQTRYRELLLLTNKSGNVDDESDLLGSATPNDYLEKIFQIPFWLKQMDAESCDRMVRGLMKASLARANGSSGGTTDGAGVTPVAASALPNAPTPEAGASASASTAQQQQQPSPAATGAADAGSTAVSDQQRRRLTLKSLEIVPEELDFMTQLAPVLGRSPRALKRFANVYRLVKVGLLSHEQRVFLRPHAPLADYQIVLLLLAVDTGAPAIARSFFAIVDEGATTKPSGGVSATAGPHTIKWLIAELGNKLTRTDEKVAWKHLKDFLTLNDDVVPSVTELADLAAWSKRVARFSFGVGRG